MDGCEAAGAAETGAADALSLSRVTVARAAVDIPSAARGPAAERVRAVGIAEEQRAGQERQVHGDP